MSKKRKEKVLGLIVSTGMVLNMTAWRGGTEVKAEANPTVTTISEMKVEMSAAVQNMLSANSYREANIEKLGIKIAADDENTSAVVDEVITNSQKFEEATAERVASAGEDVTYSHWSGDKKVETVQGAALAIAERLPKVYFGGNEYYVIGTDKENAVFYAANNYESQDFYDYMEKMKEEAILQNMMLALLTVKMRIIVIIDIRI